MMKTLLLKSSIILSLIAFGFSASAQDCQLANKGLESWSPFTDTIINQTFDAPDDWQVFLDDSLQFFKSTDAIEGSFSAGLVYDSTLECATLAQRTFCDSGFVDTISFRYKMSPNSTASDSFAYQIVYRNNVGTALFNVAFLLPTTTTHWDTLVFPITYTTTPVTTTIVDLFVYGLGGAGSFRGNYVLVDDFNFSGRTFAFVGVDEEPELSLFNVYPNPFNNEVTVNLENTSTTTIELFDVTGKLVQTETMNQLSTTINTSNIPSGVYMLRATNENGTQTQRIVKQ